MNLTVEILNLLLTASAVWIFFSGLLLHMKLSKAIKEQEKLRRKCSYTLIQIIRACVMYGMIYSVANLQWVTCGFDEKIDNDPASLMWILVEFTAQIIILKIFALGEEFVTRSREKRKIHVKNGNEKE